MHAVNIKCPNCGANLNIAEDRDQVYCEFCGSLAYSKIDSIHVVRDEAKIKELENELEKYKNEHKYDKVKLISTIVLVVIGIVGIGIGYMTIEMENYGLTMGGLMIGIKIVNKSTPIMTGTNYISLPL